MIYRIHLYDDGDGSAGYVYTASKREAETTLADWRRDFPETRRAADIESVPLPKSQRAIVGLLARWASHADNG